MLHDVAQGCYLRPGAPGELVAGNGTTTRPEDPDDWRREADPAFVEGALRRVRARMPTLAQSQAGEAWAGLDAATPDRLMLAGPAPGAEGLWLLVGGNGHGFMRAPAAGEALAALLLGATPRIDLSTYAPGRFVGAGPFAVREGYTIEGHAFT